MCMNDTIADSITRLRNAYLSKHRVCIVLKSSLILNIFQVLCEEGYIESVDIYKPENSNQEMLLVKLRYDNKCNPALRAIKRISKPGRRVYSKCSELGLHYRGLGVKIISTPKGIMPSYKAKKLKLGGEIICEAF